MMVSFTWVAMMMAGLPLAFGIPLGVPPGPQDPLLLEIAPESCLFYSTWAPMQKPDAGSANETERLLAEPQIQQSIKQIDVELTRLLGQIALREQDRTASLFAQLAPKLLRSALTEGGAMYVSRFDVAAGQPPSIEGAALVKLGAQRQEILNLLRALRQTLPAAPAAVTIDGSSFHVLKLGDAPAAPVLSWGEWRDYLVVGVGEEAVEHLVAAAGSPAPSWLNEASESFKLPRRSTLTYIDIAALRERAAAAGGPQVGAFIDAAGLTNIRTLVSVTGLDESGFVSRSRLALDGEPQGLVSIFDGQPLTADELRPIPADAHVAAAMRLNMGEALEKFRSTLVGLDPRAAREFQSALEQMNASLQIDIERDLLAALGDAWYVYTSPSSGGLVGGWTAAVAVRDPRRLQRTHDMLLGFLRGRVQQLGPSLRTMQVGEHDIHYLAARMPLVPAWSITDRELVVGLYPQAVVAHLTRPADNPALVDTAALKNVFAGDTAPLALTFVDTAPVFDFAYPLLQIGAHMALSELPPEVARLDVALLPPPSAIRPHLGPTVSTLRLTPEGYESERRQTLPGASLGGSAPIVTALLLPALQAQREAARRMQSMNNLKQIGLAMHNFHDTYRAFPPAYGTDPDGKPMLSWRVYLLPFVEQAELFQQFRLDEPWDSEHNKKLIPRMPAVYRAPTSKAGEGMTVYVTPRGPQTVFPAAEARGDGNTVPTGLGIQAITDGTSNTIAALAVSDQRAVIWTKPDDLEYDPMHPLIGLEGQHPGGFLALLCDGSVRFISAAIDPGTLNALLTRSGGEVVGGY